MPAFVVALIRSITDMETYKKYVSQVEATLAPFGGRFIARRPDPEILEGTAAPSRAVVLEFPGEAEARAWHASPAYGPVMQLRQSASEGTLLLLPAHEGRAPARRVPVGDVCYVEIVTPDPDGTRAVLAGTHGWDFTQEAALGGAHVATLPNGARFGIRAPMHEEEKPVTRSYVRVADVDAATARAEQAGATTILAPMEVPGHGRIAIHLVGGAEQGVWELP